MWLGAELEKKYIHARENEWKFRALRADLGFFLGGGGYRLSYFLGRGSDSTCRDLSKNVFFLRFYRFFLDRSQYFGLIFDFGKSARTNRKISLIPTYSDGFLSFKKSILVPINRSINLLPLFVRNCSPSHCEKYTKLIYLDLLTVPAP